MTPDSSDFLLRNCLGFVQFLPQVIVISMLLIIQCYLGTLKRGVEPKFLEIGTTGTFWKKKNFNPNMKRTHRKTWQNKNILLNMKEEKGAKDSEREEKIVRGRKRKWLLWKLSGTCKHCVNASVSATVQLFLQWNATIGALYESIYCVWISQKQHFLCNWEDSNSGQPQFQASVTPNKVELNFAKFS